LSHLELLLSGHLGVASVCFSGLKDFEDQQGVPVCSRASIFATFGRKISIFDYDKSQAVFFSCSIIFIVRSNCLSFIAVNSTNIPGAED